MCIGFHRLYVAAGIRSTLGGLPNSIEREAAPLRFVRPLELLVGGKPQHPNGSRGGRRVQHVGLRGGGREVGPVVLQSVR